MRTKTLKKLQKSILQKKVEIKLLQELTMKKPSPTLDDIKFLREAFQSIPDTPQEDKK